MNYRNRIEDSYYNLNDVVSEILADFKKDDIDLHELEEINTRLGLYSDLKRKYKMNTAEIVAYFQKISEEIEQIENFDVILADLKQQRDESYHKTLSWGGKLANTANNWRIILSIKLNSL